MDLTLSEVFQSADFDSYRLLTPVFLLLMQNPQWIPPAFEFVAVKDTVNIPLVYQLLLLELVIDGLRLAALSTPNMLSTPLHILQDWCLASFRLIQGGSIRK